MASINACEGCTGSAQTRSELNSTYDVPWEAFITNDHLCIEFTNSGSTDMSVNLWLDDSEGNGALTGTYSVSVPAGATVYQCASDFGYRADQTAPVEKAVVHTTLTTQGNLYCAIY